MSWKNSFSNLKVTAWKSCFFRSSDVRRYHNLRVPRRGLLRRTLTCWIHSTRISTMQTLLTKPDHTSCATDFLVKLLSSKRKSFAANANHIKFGDFWHFYFILKFKFQFQAKTKLKLTMWAYMPKEEFKFSQLWDSLGKVYMTSLAVPLQVGALLRTRWILSIG